MEAQIARANLIFSGTGIAFTLAALSTDGTLPAHVRTRMERHALGASLTPGAIHVIAVKTLHDVDEAGRFRSGVHWKVRGSAQPQWQVAAPARSTLPCSCRSLLAASDVPCAVRPHLIILAKKADRDVLAHELGHFFGNRVHDHTPGNVMSYVAGEADVPVFTKAQVQRVQETAACLVRRGELVPSTQHP